MFGWNLRDKLPQSTRKVSVEQAKRNDSRSKEKGKKYIDAKRRAKDSTTDIGDHVVVKNFIRKNKLSTNYGPQQYIVVQRDGTRLHLKNLETGVISNRHINHTKRIVCQNPIINSYIGTRLPLTNEETEGRKEPLNTEMISTKSNSEESPEFQVKSRSVAAKRKKKLPKYLNDFKLYKLDRN